VLRDAAGAYRSDCEKRSRTQTLAQPDMLLKHLAVVAVFYGAHVLVSIVGVGLLSRLELGNLTFDRARDPRKLALTSALILVPPLLLLYVAPHAGVLLLYLALFPLVTKVAYLDITVTELIVLLFICVMGTALVGSALSAVLGVILR
jgi:hypothetical protein